MRKLLFFLLLFSTSLAFTGGDGNSYPQDYFRSPVDHAIRLSGTFGELRPNHLHAGIDIKAKNGKVGQSLFSVADGTVSRINVRTGGYGNALYIDHPNGYTSVYAHLDKFPADIEAYVKKIQYKKKSFEVEIYPTPGRFNFEKGDVIGTLGLSGRSYGPHLHFEIRDTETEYPINPLLFGIHVKDDVRPKMHQVKFYQLSDKREIQSSKTYNLIKKGRDYGVKGDTVFFGAWRTGLAVKVYDHMPGTSNWNGVYAVSMYVDDLLVYNFDFEKFSFDESRYINAHLDYEEQLTRKSYFNRLFTLPGNQLSIYHTAEDFGVVKLSAHQAKKITIVAEDVDKNKSELEFWIKRETVEPPSGSSYNYFLPYDEENRIENGDIVIHLPENTLYENLYLQYLSSPEKSTGVYSPVYHIHNYKTPVHKYYDVQIRPSRPIPESLRSKAFIAYCGKDNVIENCGGSWEGDFLKAKVRNFGDYSIMIDTKAPVVKPINFKRNLKGYNRIDFTAVEDLKVAKNIDAITYNAYIDGNWVLMAYDPKKDKLTHRFDERTGPGEHVFRLEVSDDRGNMSVFEKPFVR